MAGEEAGRRAVAGVVGGLRKASAYVAAHESSESRWQLRTVSAGFEPATHGLGNRSMIEGRLHEMTFSLLD